MWQYDFSWFVALHDFQFVSLQMQKLVSCMKCCDLHSDRITFQSPSFPFLLHSVHPSFPFYYIPFFTFHSFPFHSFPICKPSFEFDLNKSSSKPNPLPSTQVIIIAKFHSHLLSIQSSFSFHYIPIIPFHKFPF